MSANQQQSTPLEVAADTAQLFDGGLYSAESVISALARRQGVDSDLLIPAATGFCSGVSRTSGACGAVSGAIMAIGWACGRKTASGVVDRTYSAVQSLVAGFEREFGSIACPELLGCRLGTSEGQRMFNEQRLIKRCRAYTRRGTEMAAEILDRENDAFKRLS